MKMQDLGFHPWPPEWEALGSVLDEETLWVILKDPKVWDPLLSPAPETSNGSFCTGLSFRGFLAVTALKTDVSPDSCIVSAFGSTQVKPVHLRYAPTRTHTPYGPDNVLSQHPCCFGLKCTFTCLFSLFKGESFKGRDLSLYLLGLG